MSAVVMDSFDIKGGTAAAYGATGVVAVFALNPGALEPRKGDSVVLVRPDRWFRIIRIGEVKEHGGLGRSFFLEGMTKQDVPIGTRLNWEAAPSAVDGLTSVLQPAAT
ncbi:MAG: hypothetical protein JO353_04090 [Phycisphaerae bacterium]|nr:hypothetical protein [Phycisphaerae bacterium]